MQLRAQSLNLPRQAACLPLPGTAWAHVKANLRGESNMILKEWPPFGVTSRITGDKERS